mmetsp:Transcript_25793/g.64550  ORF Transcript_25793/g.64550 Transcript_25793/m.64550 type:complete len:517 (-) Transcript_25793:246-1796(-)
MPCGNPEGEDEEESKACLNCQASFDGLKRCGKCKAVYFCSATCQREVWKAHCKVCVAPEGTSYAVPLPPPPPPSDENEHHVGAAAAAGGRGGEQSGAGGGHQSHQPAGSGPGQTPASAPPMTPAEREAGEYLVKQEELRRIKQEVLPEVDKLMRCGEFEEAIEHLEDGVAFASGFDERELLDSLSCLLARAFLGQKKPKEALMGLNPALMHARREGGPGAIKPHSIAAEAYRCLGDVDKMRVELRALIEAATESVDEPEQGAALLLAGCLLHDVGDVHAAVPLLSSAAAAGEKLGDFGMRAGARNRAGAALLRMRRPQQALEAWADELKALEDGDTAAETEAKAGKEAEAVEAAVRMEALVVGSNARGEEGAASSAAGSPNTALRTAPQPLRPLRPRPKALGDTRARRCRAHGNMFMAQLLLGPAARAAAEQHLQLALSLARQLSPAEEHEARVWVQAGHAYHLASTGAAAEGEADEADRAFAKALELAKMAGADDLIAAAQRGLAKDLDVDALLK